MSSGEAGSIYSVDTASLMEWHDRYYPVDVFPGLIGLFDGLIAQKRVLIAELVDDEVKAVGSAGLQAWAKARKAIFEPTAEHLAEALNIEGAYPGMKDPRAHYTEADAYVIAVAKLRGAIVVTQETSSSQKAKPKRTHYIPDVCSGLGIPCINILGMMRREGWRL
jgi:hypothetical protein